MFEWNVSSKMCLSEMRLMSKVCPLSEICLLSEMFFLLSVCSVKYVSYEVRFMKCV